jgi:very-short-patch-repair endonuclease
MEGVNLAIFEDKNLHKTTNRIRGTTPEIEMAARQLRQKLTPAESHLWQALKNRQLDGLRFRCQHPVGQFILDFYCPACKLAIEVDGDIHLKQTQKDAARTELLKTYGYQVLRFSNEEILTDLNRVLKVIKNAASKRMLGNSSNELSISPLFPSPPILALCPPSPPSWGGIRTLSQLKSPEVGRFRGQCHFPIE